MPCAGEDTALPKPDYIPYDIGQTTSLRPGAQRTCSAALPDIQHGSPFERWCAGFLDLPSAAESGLEAGAFLVSAAPAQRPERQAPTALFRLFLSILDAELAPALCYLLIVYQSCPCRKQPLACRSHPEASSGTIGGMGVQGAARGSHQERRRR